MKTIIKLEKEIGELDKSIYNKFSVGTAFKLKKKEGLESQLSQTKAILKIIEERLDIVNKSGEVTKDEKWIHIGVVLKGLLKEIRGDEK